VSVKHQPPFASAYDISCAKNTTSLSAQAPTAIKQQGTHLSLLVCENKAVELEDVGLDFTWVASMSIEQQARQVLHTDRQTNVQKQN